MSRKRTINVRNGFAKDVRFEVDFWKEDKADVQVPRNVRSFLADRR